MKTLTQIAKEREFTFTVTPSKASPEKFLNITVTFSSGYVSEWDWMPRSDNNRILIDATVNNFIRNAKANNEVGIHRGCNEDPCEECLAKIEAWLTSPNYAYSRERTYGTQIYHKDPTSPTGVSLAGGMGNAIADTMLRKYGHTSSLSPTEDLRTAR